MLWAPHLRAAGHTVHIANSFPAKYDYFPWMGFRPSQFLKRTVRRFHALMAGWRGYDAIIIEREIFHDSSLWCERILRNKKPALILDLDDGVFLNFPGKIEELASMVDLVVAGNGLLETWAKDHNSHIVRIPTCIDTELYQPRSTVSTVSKSLPVVGWMGTSGNVAYLKWCAEGLRNAAKKTPFILRVVAGGRGELDKIPLEGVHVEYVPWSPQDEVQQVAGFDIGLMPLADDIWSRYKCGLKLLQYMACAIPGIASPVGVNAEIIDNGVNGYLASNDEHWSEALVDLLTDPQKRSSMGQLARQRVVDHYSVQANLSKWLGAVSQTIQRRKEKL